MWRPLGRRCGSEHAMLRTTLPVQRGNDPSENDLKHDQRRHHGQPDRFPEPRAFPTCIALTMLHTLSARDALPDAQQRTVGGWTLLYVCCVGHITLLTKLGGAWHQTHKDLVLVQYKT